MSQFQSQYQRPDPVLERGGSVTTATGEECQYGPKQEISCGSLGGSWMKVACAHMAEKLRSLLGKESAANDQKVNITRG